MASQVKSQELSSQEICKLKSEMYEYVQGKLKQVTRVYSPKLQQLCSQIDSCEERVRQLSDSSNDNDLHLEEFRD